MNLMDKYDENLAHINRIPQFTFVNPNKSEESKTK